MTTREEYEQLLKDLQWLKSYHPDKSVLIKFLEKFDKFVTEENAKQSNCLHKAALRCCLFLLNK